MALALGLMSATLVVLAGYDFWQIGRTPWPCVTGPNWQADAALVLSGAPRLRRTRVAVAAWRDQHLPTIFISGAGAGGDSAEGLARAAQGQLNVPADVFKIERRATSTADNLAYSCPLLRKAGAKRVALITDSWHMTRAMATARELCAPVSFCSLPNHEPMTPERRRHEAIALFVYQLTSNAVWF